MQLLGKPHAQTVIKEAQAGLAALESPPRLVLVLASDDPATAVYVHSKERRARKLGVDLLVRDLGSDATQAALNRELGGLSRDPTVHGIVLELPLAPGLDPERAMRHIDPAKDIEGLSPGNLAMLAAGREAEALLPPTPRSVRFLLRDALELSGARVAIVGPGRTVGRPLLWMLNNRGVTVTLCNRHTRELPAVLAEQDAVVVAVGHPGLITAAHIQPHHVLVDAGINMVGGKVVGDATPEACARARAHTPVPGGVGPLTSALMFQNLLRAVRLQRGEAVEEG